jgi:hypothetical protein
MRLDSYLQLCAAIEKRELPRSLLDQPQRYPELFRREGILKVTQSLGDQHRPSDLSALNSNEQKQ